MTEPEYLTVGRILRPHGVRGELVVEVLTDFPETLPGKTIFLKREADSEPPTPSQVDSMRWHRGRLLVRLDNASDRGEVEGMRGLLILIDRSDAEPLTEGQYYHHQIIGLQAVTEEGVPLGKVTSILETGANDVYVVEKPEGGEILLPAIRDVIKGIDLAAGEIRVHLLEGMQ